jgi:hypothetical protein
MADHLQVNFVVVTFRGTQNLLDDFVGNAESVKIRR